MPVLHAGVTARKFNNLAQKLVEHAHSFRLTDLDFKCAQCPYFLQHLAVVSNKCRWGLLAAHRANNAQAFAAHVQCLLAICLCRCSTSTSPQRMLDTEYGICSVCRSFRLAWGTNAPLYAADVVLAATALLEAPPAMRAGETSARDDRSDCIWCALLQYHTIFEPSKCLKGPSLQVKSAIPVSKMPVFAC